MERYRKRIHFSAFSDLSPNSSLIRHGSQVTILIAHLQVSPVYQLGVRAPQWASRGYHPYTRHHDVMLSLGLHSAFLFIYLIRPSEHHNPAPVHVIVHYKSPFRSCFIWQKIFPCPIYMTGGLMAYFPQPKISQTPEEGPYLRMRLKRTTQSNCVGFFSWPALTAMVRGLALCTHSCSWRPATSNFLLRQDQEVKRAHIACSKWVW